MTAFPTEFKANGRCGVRVFPKFALIRSTSRSCPQLQSYLIENPTLFSTTQHVLETILKDVTATNNFTTFA